MQLKLLQIEFSAGNQGLKPLAPPSSDATEIRCPNHSYLENGAQGLKVPGEHVARCLHKCPKLQWGQHGYLKLQRSPDPNPHSGSSRPPDLRTGLAQCSGGLGSFAHKMGVGLRLWGVEPLGFRVYELWSTGAFDDF